MEDDGNVTVWQSEIDISIHVPRVEDDFVNHGVVAVAGISIHVPRVEDDVRFKLPTTGAIHFNPRPPCGGRLGRCAVGWI